MEARTQYVTKASGVIVPFSEEKLNNSLSRAGAGKEEAKSIIRKIESKLYPGISTSKIYRMAFKLLHQKAAHQAARYNLKKAIMQLGPSGFSFEKFIAELLVRQGYTVELNRIMEGKCVSHEVDIFARKENQVCIIECKYHNAQGIFCEVKVPLYVNSRFRDIVENSEQVPGKLYEGWVVTNTKFSRDSVRYGNCAGLKLMGWDYPAKNSLRELIDTNKLYPVTCLTSLNKTEKNKLLYNKVVLCKSILVNEKLLSEIGVTGARAETVLEECRLLCS